MQSKHKTAPDKAERAWLAKVAALPCSVCDAPGPSEVHEIKQGQWPTVVALCSSCHRGPQLGWHGERRMWALKKKDDLDALAVTLRRMFDAW